MKNSRRTVLHLRILMMAFTLATTLTSVTLSCPAAVMSGQATPVPTTENSSLDKVLSTQLEALDLSGIETFIQEIDREISGYFPELNLAKIIDDFHRGQFDFSIQGCLNGLWRYLLREIWANSSLLGELIVLAVICAVLQNLQVAFARAATAQLAYAVTFLVLIALALGSFTIAVNVGREAIDRMVTFVQAMLPVLLTLMVAVGGIGTAAILHPFITVTLGVLGTLIKDIVFPLIYFAAVLGVVNQISERLQVSRLAELLRSISLMCLGLFLTIFNGVLVIQGASRSVADGVALRTTKFVTGAFVPVVGKALSDALETVVGTSLLLKTAVGLAGALCLIAIAVFPAIKIIAMVLIYRLAAALVQPFGDARIANALQDMGNSLTLIFAAVVAVGLMFFIAIGIIIGLGNVTVMLR